MTDNILYALIFIGIFAVVFLGFAYLIGWGVVWVLHILFDTPYITIWWKRLLIGIIIGAIFGGGYHKSGE